MNFEHMNAIQRRLHNAACVLGTDGDEYGFEKLQRDAIAEIELLREAVRSARADEAHCWASRVDGLTAQLREMDARYMALLKAVAEGVAMQKPPPMLVTSWTCAKCSTDRLKAPCPLGPAAQVDGRCPCVGVALGA